MLFSWWMERLSVTKTLKKYVLWCTTIGFKEKYGHKSLRRDDMNLRCQSEFTAEIGHYFRRSQIIRLCYLMSFIFISLPVTQNTILYGNTWSKHRIGDVAVFFCWWVLCDCAIRETWVPHGMASLQQANVGNDMKKIFFTFDFHILPQQGHISARIIPCHCISIKRILNAVGIDTFTDNWNHL